MKGLTLTFALFELLVGCLSISAERGSIEPWQGKYWQGDINLTPDQEAILAGATQTSNTDRPLAQRWPKGYGDVVKVPVMFDHFGNFCEYPTQLKIFFLS